ncbi:MAG TPA: polyphenol oxidase family protein [Gemmatimonadaceae bacterium]|nr:polyphenol oxidase family protein [Gemmatimonadaceae bacterium]
MTAAASPALPAEQVDDFGQFGIRAFITTRAAGTFSTAGAEPVCEVMGRWNALRAELAAGGPRLATAHQVHGARVIVHGTEWEGWLRADAADGHAAIGRGTGMAVSVADCVPVFLAHPSGATALLHSGWRGTVAGIVAAGVAALAHRGVRPSEQLVHLGPAICGRCYEVSPEVYTRLTGRRAEQPTTVDLRAVIADQARAQGVRHISTSPWCTRCHNDRFFSHRAGDAGRQLGVMIAEV